MSVDPTTTAGRAELRELLSKATRPAPWAYGEDEDGEANIYWQPNSGSRLIHDLSEWDGADEDAELLVAAVNALPKLLDALDQAEERLDSMAGQARDVWLLAEKQEKEKKLWVRIASGSEFENQKGRSTLARVQKVLADLELWGHQRVTANQVARDLRAALEGETSDE